MVLRKKEIFLMQDLQKLLSQVYSSVLKTKCKPFKYNNLLMIINYFHVKNCSKTIDEKFTDIYNPFPFLIHLEFQSFFRIPFPLRYIFIEKANVL